MVNIYDFASIKKRYLLRLALFIAICISVAAIFIVSISFPGIKWVSMALSAAGCIICSVLGVVLLARPGREYRFVRQIQQGITNRETVTVQGMGQATFVDCLEFTSVSVSVLSQNGSTENRTLYVQNTAFNIGDSLNVITHNNYIVQYEIIK